MGGVGSVLLVTLPAGPARVVGGAALSGGLPFGLSLYMAGHPRSGAGPPEQDLLTAAQVVCMCVVFLALQGGNLLMANTITAGRFRGRVLMATPKCVICRAADGVLKIKEGNPDYHGKRVCRDCQRHRKLLLDTK